MMNSNLPPNWSWVKLGDIVENFKRGPFGSAIKKSFFVPEGYKVYEQKNAIYNSIELGNYFIDDTKFQELEDFEVGPGDFIVSCSGTIGKIYRLPSAAPKGVINQALLRIRLKEKKVIEKYFLELFKSSWFQKKMLVETRGSAMLNIAGVKELKQIPIPLPPLPEQKKIVEKIEELFSGLDSGVASLKKAKEQIRLYRQSVLSAAFSGKLTQEVRGERLNGIQEVSKAAEPKVGYGKDLPEGWKWVKLGEITQQVSGCAFKSTEFIDKGVLAIKISNIGYSEFVKKNQEYLPNNFLSEYKSYVIYPDDLLIALTRPITNDTTKVCFYPSHMKPALLNQRVAVLKSGDLYVKKYCFYYFQSEEFKKFLKSKFNETLQPNLSPKDLAIANIPLCSNNELSQIVEEIEKRFSEADNLEKAIDESLVKSETLRQSILSRAFSGKLV